MTGEGRRCLIAGVVRASRATFIGWTHTEDTCSRMQAVVELESGHVAVVEPGRVIFREWTEREEERDRGIRRAKLVQAKGYERLYCSACKHDLTYGQDQYFCRFCGEEFVDHGVVFAEEDVAERERQKDAGARDVR